MKAKNEQAKAAAKYCKNENDETKKGTDRDGDRL